MIIYTKVRVGSLTTKNITLFLSQSMEIFVILQMNKKKK